MVDFDIQGSDRWSRLLGRRRRQWEDARTIREVLSVFGDLRASYGLSAEQILVYLAIGAAQFEWRNDRERKTSHQCISHMIGVPKETVRRKIERLQEVGLVQVGTDGLRVAAPEKWRALAAFFRCGEGPENEGRRFTATIECREGHDA